MRSDMSKVIVERPRHGPRLKLKKGYWRRWRKMSSDEWPHQERINEQKGRTKYFSERLGPLRRYLDSQAGRPWNQVFADICKNLRQTSVIQSHVRDHVFDFVILDVMEVDGVPCFASGWRRGKPLATNYRCKLYVCPRTGILKKVKQRKMSQRSEFPNRIIVSGVYELRNLNGIWYEVELERVCDEFRKNRDVVLDEVVDSISEGKLRSTYGRFVFAIKKRRLTKSEIRRLTQTCPNIV